MQMIDRGTLVRVTGSSEGQERSLGLLLTSMGAADSAVAQVFIGKGDVREITRSDIGEVVPTSPFVFPGKHWDVAYEITLRNQHEQEYTLPVIRIFFVARPENIGDGDHERGTTICVKELHAPDSDVRYGITGAVGSVNREKGICTIDVMLSGIVDSSDPKHENWEESVGVPLFD